MDPADFIPKYPTLFHLADARSWPSIERQGLLSAAEIVRRWQVPPDRAEALLTRKRPKPPVELPHPELGSAVLRDQGPLNEDLLAPALTDGWTVADWLRRLNSFVFFFPDLERARPTRVCAPRSRRRPAGLAGARVTGRCLGSPRSATGRDGS